MIQGWSRGVNDDARNSGQATARTPDRDIGRSIPAFEPQAARSRWSCGSPAAARGHRPCRARHGKRCPKRVAHSLPLPYRLDPELHHGELGHDRHRNHWACPVGSGRQLRRDHHDGNQDQHHGQLGRPISVEGVAPRQPRYELLLSGVAGRHRPAGQRSDPHLHLSARGELERIVQLRRLWRLGSGVRRFCQPGPGQRPQPDRTERRPFRRHDRRHRIPERGPEELR